MILYQLIADRGFRRDMLRPASQGGVQAVKSLAGHLEKKMQSLYNRTVPGSERSMYDKVGSADPL